MENSWIRRTLRENGFVTFKNYVMRRNGDSAHIGTVPGDRWAVTLFVNRKSQGNFYTEEQLKEYFKNELREKKLKRIIKKQK
ncbi:MAG: hypothetical protein M0R46_11580 [Candidatus Muirbacterium halophilum]|nr:hypothetical protein [Candidatus Muirbacterium halophilum]